MHTSFMAQFGKNWSRLASAPLHFALIPNKGGEPHLWISHVEGTATPEFVLRKAAEADVKLERSVIWVGTIEKVSGKPQLKIDEEGSKGAISTRQIRSTLIKLVKSMDVANERDGTKIQGQPLARASVWLKSEQATLAPQVKGRASIRSKLTGGAWSKLEAEVGKLEKAKSSADVDKRLNNIRANAGAWLLNDSARETSKDPEKAESGWKAFRDAVAASGDPLTPDEVKLAANTLQRRLVAAQKLDVSLASSLETLVALREEAEDVLDALTPEALASVGGQQALAAREAALIAWNNASKYRQKLIEEGMIDEEDEEGEEGFGTYAVDDPPVVITAALVAGRLPTPQEWQQSTTSTFAGNRGTNNPAIVEIDNLLAAVAAAPDDAATFLALKDLEKKIYEGVNLYDEAERSSVRLPALLGLLDTVQDAFTRTITAGLQADPDALADAVSGGDPQARADWVALVGNTGKIKIRDTVRAPQFTQLPGQPPAPVYAPIPGGNGEMSRVFHDEVHAGFREKTLANFARLMQTSGGRRVVHKVQTGDTGAPLPGRGRAADQHMDVEICPERGMEVANGLLRGASLGAAAGRLGPTENAANVWNAQRGTQIRIPDVSHDSDGSPSVTRGGRPLLSPVWLVLGHELIHAKHNLVGRNRKGNPGHNRTQQEQQDFAAVWTNDEEERTIALGQVSENRLRRHAGLWVPRFGHHGDGDQARALNPGRTAPGTSLVAQLEVEVGRRLGRLGFWTQSLTRLDAAIGGFTLALMGNQAVDYGPLNAELVHLPSDSKLDDLIEFQEDLADAVRRVAASRHLRTARRAVNEAAAEVATAIADLSEALADATRSLDEFIEELEEQALVTPAEVTQAQLGLARVTAAVDPLVDLD